MITFVKIVAIASPLASALTLSFSQPAKANCTFFSAPQRYNTQAEGDVVVIGEQRDRPYRVVIPGGDDITLQRIQACILDAFATRSSFGTYLQVASFDRRGDAEGLRRILRGEGYNARVTYARSR